jgi:hypothetical protein
MMCLDHVGFIGGSISELRRVWLEAGFFVTEPEALMAVDPVTGQQASLGQHSCHVIFERGYIELTAVNPVTPSHHLYPWIKAGRPLGIVAIGTEDIEGVHARLTHAQLAVGSICQASRQIHYGSRRGEAVFTWFALGAASTPESLLCFVRNERPDLIYQSEVQQHPNCAQALEGVIICSEDADQTAGRYGIYADCSPEGIAAGLFRCSLQSGVILIGTAAALQNHFGKQVALSASREPRSIGVMIARREQPGASIRNEILWF